MKRFHVHVGVENLDASIRFYSGLFGTAPTVRKDDYAKWMIQDPRINFAISRRDNRVGVNHLGLQADSADELADIRAHFAAAGPAVIDEPDASCCYAKSDKHWVTDPQGIAWEGYHTLGEIRYFDGNGNEALSAPCGTASSAGSTCCAGEKTAETTMSRSGCCALIERAEKSL
jgi:catechol 2,3-dioxygenase-like lactoylglutathione lyase family enzyme